MNAPNTLSAVSVCPRPSAVTTCSSFPLHQIGQVAKPSWDRAAELIRIKIQHLQIGKVDELGRDRAAQLVRNELDLHNGITLEGDFVFLI